MADLHWLVWLALIAAFSLAISIVASRWLWRVVARMEPQYFERQPGPAGPPKCPACGYHLYFAEGQRCPECGRTFEIKELDMRLAEWDGIVLRPKEAEPRRGETIGQ